MAKKKENTRQYLEAVLPEETKKYKTTRVNWGGLNLKNTYNSGELSYADGISVSDLPYIDTERSAEPLTEAGWAKKYEENGCKILGFYIYNTEEHRNCYVVVYSKNDLDFNGIYTTGEAFVKVDVIFEKFTFYSATTSGVGEKNGEEKSYFSLTSTICRYPVEKTSDTDIPAKKFARCIVAGKEKFFGGDYLVKSEQIQEAYDYYKENAAGTDTLRTIIEFNSYNNTSDPAGTSVNKKLLIFPDRVSFFAKITGLVWTASAPSASSFSNSNFSRNTIYYNTYNTYDNARNYVVPVLSYDEDDEVYTSTWAAQSGFISYLGDTYPGIKYAAVNNQRLYGVDDTRIYVSGYNDYADFDVDNVLYSTAAGAWVTTTQASASKGGNFTAIVGFGEEAIAFKDNYMYRVTGTTNPFRLRELCATGCVDGRSVCELDGRLYFASQNAVYVYRDGYLPAIISQPIEQEITNIQSALGYIENNRYHLNTNGAEYIYDTLNGKWTKKLLTGNIVSCSHKKDYDDDDKKSPDILVFATENSFLKISEKYRGNWSFRTDFVNQYTSDLKKPHKLQLMYEADPGADIRLSVSNGREDFPLYSRRCGEKERTIMTARVLMRYRDLVNYSIVISGSGYVRLHALEIIYEAGGELFE